MAKKVRIITETKEVLQVKAIAFAAIGLVMTVLSAILLLTATVRPVSVMGVIVFLVGIAGLVCIWRAACKVFDLMDQKKAVVSTTTGTPTAPAAATPVATPVSPASAAPVVSTTVEALKESGAMAAEVKRFANQSAKETEEREKATRELYAHLKVVEAEEERLRAKYS